MCAAHNLSFGLPLNSIGVDGGWAMVVDSGGGDA